ncbi:TadA family conjugal transfer-associated ATPase [Microbacterium sp. cf332]|uniref:TadA family conjugal transfer-associated ATPase n=1 Tax=Microbacterium sp. cf332 TaxID=1761804 RepID=UPI000890AD61|nr:TadA family conjugal transfer-associated ATPase [Microbacterium sp. cf332]SDQ84514.1 pilus assembly protein CpaF [Microbacterium sp. cf332]
MPSPFVVVPRPVGSSVRAPRSSDAPLAEALADPVAAAGEVPAQRELPDHDALDPLREYLLAPDVTDVFVNGEHGLFVDRGRGAEHIPGWRPDDAEVRALAVTLISLGGRHIDDATPCVDVRWAGGIRVHAVLSPVACAGAAISIRLPAAEQPGLDELEQRGMFEAPVGEQLRRLVADRTNVLVTGATGVGKTTVLAALLSNASPRERIVTIEDVAELRLEHPHHVRLEARQPNLEGAGAVPLARLVREALRMRPDRLVVGECRGEEIRELLTALNTGHHGGAGTVHASGLADVPARLEALGALAGLDDHGVARQVVSAIGAVVHLGRVDGVRQVTGIARPVLDGARLALTELV